MLSPKLYDILRQRFGAVRVCKAGEAAVWQHPIDAISRKPKLVVVSGGEEYAANCPFCGDWKQHLYVNHRFGTVDPVTGSEVLHLAHCFRCGEPKTPDKRRELARRIFGFMNADQRRQLMVVQPGIQAAPDTMVLSEVAAPGRLELLSNLTPGSQAVAYLASRGFDIEELSNVWGVTYCLESSEFPRIEGRVVIPIVMNGKCVGWQARYVGDRQDDTIAKYYTMPGLPKRLVLYNHDLARRQPCVVICEGVTDVWSVGPCGVALLGKQASQQQLQLLRSGWVGKPAVILLDGDAKVDADALARQLQPFFPKGLVQVALPEDVYPGSMARGTLWASIVAQAAELGVPLPETLSSAEAA